MSATIYQFPAGGRAASPPRESKPAQPSTNTAAVSAVITACGAAWYHEEAVKEDEQTER